MFVASLTVASDLKLSRVVEELEKGHKLYHFPEEGRMPMILHHQLVALVLSLFILTTSLCASTTLRELIENERDESVFVKRMMHSVHQTISKQPLDYRQIYCVIFSGSANGAPLAMVNMLRVDHRAQMMINAATAVFEECRTCDKCEHVIVFTSMIEAPKVIENAGPISSVDVDLLVVISESLESEEEAEGNAKTVVDLAWKQFMECAMILVPVGDRILAMKSERNVSLKPCTPEQPRVVARWENGTMAGNLSFRSLDYNDCVIRVASGNCELFSRLDEVEGQVRMVGVEEKIIETIADRHNFTIEVIDAVTMPDSRLEDRDGEVLSYFQRILAKLKSDEADVGACSLAMGHDEAISFSTSYANHYIVVMVPVSNDIPFASLLRPFGDSVWIAMLFSLVAGWLLIRVNRKALSWSMVLAVFLGESLRKMPRGFVEKFQVIVWVVYGYLMTQSYIASLASVLNNPQHRMFDSIEELADVGVPVAGPTYQRGNFEDEARLRPIVQTFVALDQNQYSDLVNNPRNVDELKGIGGQVAVLIDELEVRRWGSKYYRLREGVGNFPVGMVTLRRSVLSLNDIVPTIRIITETGLTSKWISDELLDREKRLKSLDTEIPSQILSLQEVTGLFMVLVAGLALGMIVFGFELVMYRNKGVKELKSPRKLLIQQRPFH